MQLIRWNTIHSFHGKQLPQQAVHFPANNDTQKPIATRKVSNKATNQQLLMIMNNQLIGEK